MAALYLHHALFSTEPSLPPSLVLRAPSRAGHHERQLSNITTVTSISDNTHPTESLLHGSGSTVYLDLLARQPSHPNERLRAALDGLDLHGDPITPREYRSRWEHTIRKRLRTLRWTSRALRAVAGAWAVINTIRYFLAVALYTSRTRRIVAVALGTGTALSLALELASLLVAAGTPPFGQRAPNALHIIVQCTVGYLASILLFGPAAVNFALVFAWRHTTDRVNTLQGRCQWDIDVVWSGEGEQCGGAPPWGFWLAGALVRLLLTLAVLVAHHVASHKYATTRQPVRHKRTRSGRSEPSATEPNTAGSRTMAASAVLPVSISFESTNPTSTDGRCKAQSTPRSLRKGRTLWSTRSRLASPGTSQDAGPSAPARNHSNFTSTSVTGEENDSSGSSDEDGDTATSRYGRELRRLPGAYATPPPPASFPLQTQDAHDARDLNNFASHFRALVLQFSRETDAARLNPDRTTTESNEEDEGDAHVPVLGRTVHRMPTIESLGSREVLSPATSSRANTDAQSMSSPGRSRAGSWVAATALGAKREGETWTGEIADSPVTGVAPWSGPGSWGSHS
ncbi:hypothetical protein OBBRIDRAFT_773220 [Obba rivulosa]|uniref:Uncharacterized protein n=1 Tax=Obba rivulosa TaxID=1052685 RepID=A0A8E2B5Q6_9APHY|nr:hypothetical protein OBBRIDRAFT_773220 [Obba rivulosa]